jgi:hypothetical protein
MAEHEEKRLTETPIKDCCEFIRDNFDNIIPFEVKSGYGFQIRMGEATYRELPEKYKSELKQFAYFGEQRVRDSIWQRYLLDYFWTYTQEYIFNFNIEKAISIETKCVYGYEGVEDSDQEIVFIDVVAFPEFIMLNIGLGQKDILKYPKDAHVSVSSV